MIKCQEGNTIFSASQKSTCQMLLKHSCLTVMKNFQKDVPMESYPRYSSRKYHLHSTSSHASACHHVRINCLSGPFLHFTHFLGYIRVLFHCAAPLKHDQAKWKNRWLSSKHLSEHIQILKTIGTVGQFCIFLLLAC